MERRGPAAAAEAARGAPPNQPVSSSSTAVSAADEPAPGAVLEAVQSGHLDQLAPQDAGLEQLLQGRTPGVGAVVEDRHQTVAGGEVDQHPQHRLDPGHEVGRQLGRHLPGDRDQAGSQHEEVVVRRALPLPAVVTDRSRQVGVEPVRAGEPEVLVRGPAEGDQRPFGRGPGAVQPSRVVVRELATLGDQDAARLGHRRDETGQQRGRDGQLVSRATVVTVSARQGGDGVGDHRSPQRLGQRLVEELAAQHPGLGVVGPAARLGGGVDLGELAEQRDRLRPLSRVPVAGVPVGGGPQRPGALLVLHDPPGSVELGALESAPLRAQVLPGRLSARSRPHQLRPVDGAHVLVPPTGGTGGDPSLTGRGVRGRGRGAHRVSTPPLTSMVSPVR